MSDKFVMISTKKMKWDLNFQAFMRNFYIKLDYEVDYGPLISWFVYAND